MYEEHYGLQAPPFNITPDPAYLFFSRRHRQAFEHILFGVSERKGFIQITGEVGAGKSTICRKVLEELRDGYATALILNPVMTPIQLMRSILRELHLDDAGNDRVRLVERLNEFLLAPIRLIQLTLTHRDRLRIDGVALLKLVNLGDELRLEHCVYHSLNRDCDGRSSSALLRCRRHEVSEG